MSNKIYEISDTCFLFLKSEYNVKFRNEILKIIKQKKLIPEDRDDLENLHNIVYDKNNIDYDITCGLNNISKGLYETTDEFNKIYFEFIFDLYNQLKFDFYYQSIPTIRIHCPNVKNQHFFPKYHSDCFFGHPPEEINLWIPLTNNEHSGFYFMDEKKSRNVMKEFETPQDFLIRTEKNPSYNTFLDSISEEVKCDNKHIFLFDSQCIHTTQQRYDDTRVSIDIRINPVDGFVDGYSGAGRMKAEFKPGGRSGYYEHSIDEILKKI